MKITTAIAAAMLAAAGTAHAQSWFHMIPTGRAFCMSADGQWITGQVRDGSNNYYRYNSVTGLSEPIPTDGLLSFDGLPTPSNDGTKIVGNFMDNGVSVPGVWEQGIGWTAIPPTPDAINLDNNLGAGFGISGDGSTTSGFFWAPGTGDAFESAGGTTNELPNSNGGSGSRGTVINYDGSVVAGFDAAPVGGHRRAAVWTNGVLDIVASDDRAGDIEGMNSVGDIVVGSGDRGFGERNMMWKFNGVDWDAISLGADPRYTMIGAAYSALDVSNDGRIVVGVGRYGGSMDGWIWTEATGLIDLETYLVGYGLELDGFEIGSANAISDDGRIITGYGWDPGLSTVTGWVARLDVPAPACTPADVTTQGAGLGDPGYGVPDNQITGADIQYYVNAWIAGDLAIADVTTQGAASGTPLYGVPDGVVTGADINFYVNLWVAGCP